MTEFERGVEAMRTRIINVLEEHADCLEVVSPEKIKAVLGDDEAMAKFGTDVFAFMVEYIKETAELVRTLDPTQEIKL